MSTLLKYAAPVASETYVEYLSPEKILLFTMICIARKERIESIKIRNSIFWQRKNCGNLMRRDSNLTDFPHFASLLLLSTIKSFSLPFLSSRFLHLSPFPGPWVLGFQDCPPQLGTWDLAPPCHSSAKTRFDSNHVHTQEQG